MKLIKCFAVLLGIVGVQSTLSKNVFAGKDAIGGTNLSQEKILHFERFLNFTPYQKDKIKAACLLEVYAKPPHTECTFLVGGPPKHKPHFLDDYLDVILELKNGENETIYTQKIGSIAKNDYNGNAYRKKLNITYSSTVKSEDVLASIKEVIKEEKNAKNILNAIYNDKNKKKDEVLGSNNINAICLVVAKIKNQKGNGGNDMAFSFIAKVWNDKRLRKICDTIVKESQRDKTKTEKVLEAIFETANKSIQIPDEDLKLLERVFYTENNSQEIKLDSLGSCLEPGCNSDDIWRDLIAKIKK